MREAGHVAVELDCHWKARSSSTNLQTKATKRAATSSAVVSGATCDRHISILRWCHLLPEAMLIWNQHSCSGMQSAQRAASTKKESKMWSEPTSTLSCLPAQAVWHLRVT